MPAPDQMFEHGLDVKKGWFGMTSLDHSAKMASAVDYVVPAGRVVHLNANGAFEPGVELTQMAVFLIAGSNAADVSNPGTTAGGLFMHQAISPTGVVSGLVATGGYEIATTEFVTANTYAPNELLKAPVGNASEDSAVGGVLTNASVTQYVTAVCGVVSSGKATNHNGVSTLSFWPVYLPAGTAATVD